MMLLQKGRVALNTVDRGYLTSNWATYITNGVYGSQLVKKGAKFCRTNNVNLDPTKYKQHHEYSIKELNHWK